MQLVVVVAKAEEESENFQFHKENCEKDELVQKSGQNESVTEITGVPMPNPCDQ